MKYGALVVMTEQQVTLATEFYLSVLEINIPAKQKWNLFKLLWINLASKTILHFILLDNIRINISWYK